MDLTLEQTMGIKEWNKSVTNAVESTLGSKLDGSFIAANYTPGFNYAVKQQYYNADSLSTLDSLVVITNDIPTLSDHFSTLYKRVIGNLEYGFSEHDKKLMNEEETCHGSLVGSIINDYMESGLDDTPQKYPTIFYITQRIKEVTKTGYLHLDTKQYPSLAPLCRKLSEYTRLSTYTNKMQDAWDLADNRMKAIYENISNPSDNNGGLKTDACTFMIGWDKLPETQQLLKELKKEDSISISLKTDHIDSSSSLLKIGTETSVKVPFFWFFNIKTDNKTSIDLSRFTQNGSSITINVTYKGLTMLGAIPTPLTENNAKGWFAPDILRDAAIKSKTDSTGYRLHGSEFNPDTLFGKNGTLKRLKTFVISQEPEIKLQFHNFNVSSMKEIFNTSSNVSFSLLGGLVRGTINHNYTLQNESYDSQSQTLSVTISPTPIGESGSIGKQTAFVLGGVAETYGA